MSCSHTSTEPPTLLGLQQQLLGRQKQPDDQQCRHIQLRQAAARRVRACVSREHMREPAQPGQQICRSGVRMLGMSGLQEGKVRPRLAAPAEMRHGAPTFTAKSVPDARSQHVATASLSAQSRLRRLRSARQLAARTCAVTRRGPCSRWIRREPWRKLERRAVGVRADEGRFR